MAGQTITIQIKGDEIDEEHVRFSEFVEQLDRLRNALKRVDHLVSGSEEKSVYYRIIDLRHSSPATLALEAKPLEQQKDYSAIVVDKFLSGLRQIEKTGKAPADFDIPTLEAFKGLTKMLQKHISEVTIGNGDYTVTLTRELGDRIDQIIGPDEIMEGSIAGMLELINIHNKTNKFHIYPAVGPRKVVCQFPAHLLNKALSAINRHVNVIGKLKYKQRDSYPYGVAVSEIEIYPPDEELPSLEDIRGIEPNVTGDMSSEDFIRSMRDGQE